MERRMGKAYSEDEKNQIRIRLMEEGVKLFHENGSKTLNIRELTKRAGIAQGGFYSFYEDKDALIRDIVSYRGSQKLRIMEETLPQSLEAPMDYLKKGFCWYVVDLIRKAQTSTMYADAIDLILRDMKRDKKSFHVETLDEIFDYWRQAGYEVAADGKGIENLTAAAFVLGLYGECLDETYREQAVETLIYAGLDRYLEVKKK